MEYTIYQVKRSEARGRLFMDSQYLAAHELKISVDAYERIYAGVLNSCNNFEEALTHLWEEFNIHHPTDFAGHSLSVSDVVALTCGGLKKVFFCDDIGWTEVPDFLKPEIRQIGTVKIHVCPNRCESLFATPAHVVQTWKTDTLGNFVEEISTDATTHGPDDSNIWECLECGAEAELVECHRFEVSVENTCGEVFIPTVPRGYAYWLCNWTASIKYIPILPDQRDIPTLEIEKHRLYLSEFV